MCCTENCTFSVLNSTYFSSTGYWNGDSGCLLHLWVADCQKRQWMWPHVVKNGKKVSWHLEGGHTAHSRRTWWHYWLLITLESPWLRNVPQSWTLPVDSDFFIDITLKSLWLRHVLIMDCSKQFRSLPRYRPGKPMVESHVLKMDFSRRFQPSHSAEREMIFSNLKPMVRVCSLRVAICIHYKCIRPRYK